MSAVRGAIRDRATGRQLEARVRVVAPSGTMCTPNDAVFKAGGDDGGRPAPPNGLSFFYSDGTLAVDVPGCRICCNSAANLLTLTHPQAPQVVNCRSTTRILVPRTRGFAAQTARVHREGFRLDGGAQSHCAPVAREYGIPGVVGTRHDGNSQQCDAGGRRR
jgi:hypothetical protein